MRISKALAALLLISALVISETSLVHGGSIPSVLGLFYQGSAKAAQESAAAYGGRMVRGYYGANILIVPQHQLSISNSTLNSVANGLGGKAARPPAAPLRQRLSTSPAIAGAAGALGSSPAPAWDEQIGTSFTEGFSSMAYNVSAVAQNGSYGYGPAYLLDGLSTSGYWYQVGLAYNWPYSSGGYSPGFDVVYDVFNSTAHVVLPENGGGGIMNFSGPVYPGDRILLNLYFSGGNVVMLAYDWNTSASAQVSYSAKGASGFVGDASSFSNADGFFSGLMTEEYHAYSYSGNEKEAPYLLSGPGVSSAWQWADEWAPSNDSVLFGNYGGPISYSGTGLHAFYLGGTRQFGNGTAFITGSPSVVASLSNATINAGGSLNVTSAAANGTDPYTYQWLEEEPGANSYNIIAGASSSLLKFSTGQSADPGMYKIISSVTDAEKVVESSQIVGILVVGNTTTTSTSSTTTSTTTTTTSTVPSSPQVLLPQSTSPSGPSAGVKVSVSGTGFEPGSLVNFGYSSNFPPYANAILAATANSAGGWYGTFSAPWKTGSYEMIAIDAASGQSASANLVVTSQTTSNGPSITLPATVVESSSSGLVSVSVSGSGFTPGDMVNLGYASNFPPYANAIVAATISSSGMWSGTFSAPWEKGNYTMTAIDAAGLSATATLVVGAPTSAASITLPANVQPSGSSGLVKVNVSGSGFTPGDVVNFGYSSNFPPDANAIVAATVGSNGTWSGTFSAPWKAGNYSMSAIDAKGVSAAAVLEVK